MRRLYKYRTPSRRHIIGERYDHFYMQQFDQVTRSWATITVGYDNTYDIRIGHMRGNDALFELYYERRDPPAEVTFVVGGRYFLRADKLDGPLHVCQCVITNDFLLYEAERIFDYTICRYCGAPEYHDFDPQNEDINLLEFLQHINKCKKERRQIVSFRQLLIAAVMSGTAHLEFEYALGRCI